MGFYRSTFPQASVLPKMHLMESHMVPWLRKWHLGFGMMGEQGAESIHASFNSIERSFANMIHNRVDRLLSVVKEHHLRILPANITLLPPVKTWMTAHLVSFFMVFPALSFKPFSKLKHLWYMAF